MVAAIGAYAPVFLDWREHARDVLTETSILFMMALAQMMVILTRGIDLSVAANLALSGMLRGAGQPVLSRTCRRWSDDRARGADRGCCSACSTAR